MGNPDPEVSGPAHSQARKCQNQASNPWAPSSPRALVSYHPLPASVGLKGDVFLINAGLSHWQKSVYLAFKESVSSVFTFLKKLFFIEG